MKQCVLKVLGTAKNVLGMNVSCKDGKIILNQCSYIGEVLVRFIKMTNCKHGKTPMAVCFKLVKAE